MFGSDGGLAVLAQQADLHEYFLGVKITSHRAALGLVGAEEIVDVDSRVAERSLYLSLGEAESAKEE